MKIIERAMALLMLCLMTSIALAQSGPGARESGVATREYLLGAGDVIRVAVFQNPDLTTEARLSELGAISYPLLGSVPVGGMTLGGAERKIAQMLKDGNFVVQPQVTIQLLQVRANQIAVLGYVNRPGRFPLETFNMRLSEALAQAGGISQGGADTVALTGLREGKPFFQEIDVQRLLAMRDSPERDVSLSPGDTLYVDRAPVFYIYGEVQRPGMFRLDRDMTVMQGLALGGGITMRGTIKGMQIHRQNGSGPLSVIEPVLGGRLQANDVIYVRESMF